jgi:hypothetical protein
MEEGGVPPYARTALRATPSAGDTPATPPRVKAPYSYRGQGWKRLWRPQRPPKMGGEGLIDDR